MVDRHCHLNFVAADGGVRRGPRFQSPSGNAVVVVVGPRFQPPHGFHAALPHEVFMPHRFHAALPHEVFAPENLARQRLINSTAVDAGAVRGPRLQRPPESAAVRVERGFNIPETMIRRFPELISFSTFDGDVLIVPDFQQPPSLAAAGVFAPSPPLPYIDGADPPPPYIYPPIPLQNPQNMFHVNIQENLRPQERDAGLSEDVIAKNLQTRTCCEATTRNEDDQEICVVCQQDLHQEKQTVGILKCGHEYHASCIKSWLQRKNICPLCRAIAL